MKERLPFLLILLAALLWGTTGTTQTFAPEHTHPVALGAVRLAVGGLSLLLIVMLQGKLSFKNWPIVATLLAAISMACYQPLFFTAVKMTGIAVGTVIALGSAPILAGFLEWLVLKKRPSFTWWMATLLSITGCLMLFMNRDTVAVNPLGIVLALGAGLSFAVYTIVSKDILARQAPLTSVAVVFTLSAIILSPFLFIFDLSWLLEFSGIAVSVHLGIVTLGFAYVLFNKGLITVPSSTAVTLSLGEPLTAALLGVFLVGEQLSPLAWTGVALLLCGIAVLAYSPRTHTGQKVQMNQ